VGIDLERADRHVWRTMQVVAEPAEFARVADAGVPDAFVPTVLWTLKEAALKGAGLGLALHPRRAVISGRGWQDWVVHLPGPARAWTAWSVASWIRDGWALALAWPLAVVRARECRDA
jgi:phosphopantetheinyl transferase